MRVLLGIHEIWLVRRDCKCLKVRLIRYGILQYLVVTVISANNWEFSVSSEQFVSRENLGLIA